MNRTIRIAAGIALGIGSVGFAAIEISAATGDGAIDSHVVRAPVQEVVVKAEDGDVTLVRATDGVHVRVKRNHLINSPETSERLTAGVLTLKTRCPLGFVTCRSDYRIGVPAGVRVTIDKPSGRVDARAIGGQLTELDESGAPVTVNAR